MYFEPSANAFIQFPKNKLNVFTSQGEKDKQMISGGNTGIFMESYFFGLPNARRDLLILAPSLNRAPLFPVADPFSDPAKSIMESFATFMSDDVPELRLVCFT